MVYQGHVENGTIHLQNSVVLPEGAEVRVEIVAPADRSEPREGRVSLYDRLKPLIGAAKGLPSDASVNVDHYLYGHPKK
jgi:predicted DNA-binding antitoxin AbrB/MazE fold protein